MKRIDVVLAALSKSLAVVSGVTLVGVMVALVADVILKAVRNDPVDGLLSYLQIALVALVFLAMPLAQRLDVHVAMGLVTDALPKRVSHGLQALGWCVVVPVVGYVTYNTVLLAFDSMDRRESTLDIVAVPVWPARMFLALGLIVLTLEMSRSLLLHAGYALKPPVRAGEERTSSSVELHQEVSG